MSINVRVLTEIDILFIMIDNITRTQQKTNYLTCVKGKNKSYSMK